MNTIDQFNFSHQKVLIRVDFNVPQNENLEVTDNTRILAAKATIQKVLKEGGAVILMTHLGRPKNGFENQFSLKNIVSTVETVLEHQVIMAEDVVGEDAQQKAENLKPGEILLLENLRFHSEETAGDVDFAKKLSELGDFYVNDAFGTAHRAHASTAIIAQFFPEKKAFGYLMQKELEAIEKVLVAGKKPITAILGGAKVSSKITIINHILPVIDHLIIGGGMTYTFIKAQGGAIGNSLVEEDKMTLALEILEACQQQNVQVHLPVDNVIADAFSNDANTEIVPIDAIPEGWMGLDIGPKTEKIFEEVLLQSKTILWNGPLGVFELPKFAKGTVALGNAIAESTKNGAFSLVGGGDSVAFVKQFHFDDQVSYVSTGGGAMLESLEGKELPGVAAINQ
ncbi:MAG TPA: phosphoglycerate kinase [Moheibacter sp.]|nr:phosphoglycerate kinase [Moheibacter sp.]